MKRIHTATQDQAARSALIVIAVILFFSALRIGAEVFAPLVMALVTGVILAPVMEWLEKARIPRSIAALLVLMSGVLFVAVLAFLAEPIIWRLVDELPRIKWEIRGWVEEFRGAVRNLDEVNKQVEEVLGTGSSDKVEDAEPAVPSLTNALFLAPRILAQFLIFLGALYFFLLTRKGTYAWISRQIAGEEEVDRIEQRFTNAENLVSRYFLTISVINAGLGAALAGVLTVIGLPGAVVWGAVAALLNFVVYLGPAVMVGALTFAGIVAFHGLISFAPPLAFLFLNMLESQFVTPALIGRNISLNPLLIFVSLVFWLWLWGPVGGIVAIPVLLISIALLDILSSEDEDRCA
ncbi:AI-2E family transporter [Roseovarius sp. CAU 1744]|uniref:AI-2E family transporter n=1 Tax=Roseovarius sp. CAU 1744 TaxID=3140368 RepID=UPI00325B3BA0